MEFNKGFENVVYNCDCLDLMDEMIKQDIRANCVLTDIPYDKVNRKSTLRNLDKKNADIKTFELEDYLPKLDKCFNGNAIIFCATEQISEIRNYFSEKKITTRVIVWQKNNPSPMNGEFVYLSGIELAVWIKKKGSTFNAFCKNTVFKHNSGKNNIHPTEKPLSLWIELLNDNTKENELILDTCMGSFTTAVACHKLNRRFLGAELDKEYYDLGQKRLEQEQNQVSIFDL